MTTESYLKEGDLHLLVHHDNNEAFEMFYNKYAPMVYGMILKVVENENRAAEIFEKVFSESWNKICNHDLDTSRCLVSILSLTRKHITEAGIKKNLLENLITKEQLKNIYELALINGCTIQEIADKLKISPQEVKNEIRNVLKGTSN